MNYQITFIPYFDQVSGMMFVYAVYQDIPVNSQVCSEDNGCIFDPFGGPCVSCSKYSIKPRFKFNINAKPFITQ